METEDKRGTLPPEQVADLASRCGIKGSAVALAEFAILVRSARPLPPEEMRPVPPGQPVEAAGSDKDALLNAVVDAANAYLEAVPDLGIMVGLKDRQTFVGLGTKAILTMLCDGRSGRQLAEAAGSAAKAEPTNLAPLRAASDWIRQQGADRVANSVDKVIAELAAAPASACSAQLASVAPLDFDSWFDEKSFAWEFKKYGPTDAARILWDAARRGLSHVAAPATGAEGAQQQTPAEPVAHLRWWARQFDEGHGNIGHEEGFEVCKPSEISDDGTPAFPVYAAPTESAAAPADTNAIADYIADNWPMKKYTLEEIETRLRALATNQPTPTGEKA